MGKHFSRVDELMEVASIWLSENREPTEEEADALVQKYGELSTAEVAVVMGVTASNINQIQRKLYKVMKARLGIRHRIDSTEVTDYFHNKPMGYGWNL